MTKGEEIARDAQYRDDGTPYLSEGGLARAIDEAISEARNEGEQTGLTQVVKIRCVERGHHLRPTYNTNESSGGECAACVYDQARYGALMQARQTVNSYLPVRSIPPHEECIVLSTGKPLLASILLEIDRLIRLCEFREGQ